MYNVTYQTQYGTPVSQSRDTLQEAVAYALILEAREDLNVKVVSIERIEK
jgi:hypothetical protein